MLAWVLALVLAALVMAGLPVAGVGPAEPAGAAGASEKACVRQTLSVNHTAPPYHGDWVTGSPITVPVGGTLRYYITGSSDGGGYYHLGHDDGSGWEDGPGYIPDGTFESNTDDIHHNDSGGVDHVRVRFEPWADQVNLNVVLMVTYGTSPNYTCGPVIDDVPEDEPRGECTHASAADPVNTLNGNFFDDWNSHKPSYWELPGWLRWP